MMKTLIFLDTETTGTSEQDRLIQLAYRTSDGEEVNELFNPGLPIAIEAMAVHHITEKMVKGKPRFQESPVYDRLRERLERGDIVVAHNASFDVAMLEKEGLKVPSYIDTLKVARYLDPEAKISSYSLQYLRYLLGIEVEANAHDAWGDILVLEKLFYRMLKKMKEVSGKPSDVLIEEMVRISCQPALIRRMNFGKYRGKLLSDLAERDPEYLRWLLAEKEKSPKGEEDWIYSLRKVLGLPYGS